MEKSFFARYKTLLFIITSNRS